MLTIDSAEAMARALDMPLDPDLKRLLRQRRDDLDDPDYDFGELARVAVVEPGDTLADAEAALGIQVATNLVTGLHHGEEGFTPSWEWAELHGGGWTELAFVLSDSGYGHVLLVPDRDDVDRQLIALCREHAVPAHEQVGPEPA